MMRSSVIHCVWGVLPVKLYSVADLKWVTWKTWPSLLIVLQCKDNVLQKTNERQCAHCKRPRSVLCSGPKTTTHKSYADNLTVLCVFSAHNLSAGMKLLIKIKWCPQPLQLCVCRALLLVQNCNGFQYMWNRVQAFQKGGVKITPFEDGKMMCCRLGKPKHAHHVCGGQAGCPWAWWWHA